jgi:hypothetical protein
VEEKAEIIAVAHAANNLSVLRRLLKRHSGTVEQGVEYEAVAWAIRTIDGCIGLCDHADRYPRGTVKAFARKLRALMAEL